MICDVDFNPTNSDVIVSIGKEHLAWWNVLPEQAAVSMQFKADYGVHIYFRMSSKYKEAIFYPSPSISGHCLLIDI